MGTSVFSKTIIYAKQLTAVPCNVGKQMRRTAVLNRPLKGPSLHFRSWGKSYTDVLS